MMLLEKSVWERRMEQSAGVAGKDRPYGGPLAGHRECGLRAAGGGGPCDGKDLGRRR